MSKRIFLFCIVALFVLTCLSQVTVARNLPVVKQASQAQKEIPRPPFVAADVETLYMPFPPYEDCPGGLPEGWEFVDLKCEEHWHVTTYGAYDTHSYFCGVETPTQNGYMSYWADWLDSPEIPITTAPTSMTLEIVHKVDTEDPTQPYWDGSAVFVSADGGLWELVTPSDNVFPDTSFSGYAWPDSMRAWECHSMANTPYERLEGLPGWAGMGDDWFTSTFDLSDYAGASTIKVRYAFVSDWGMDTFEDDELEGCWLESMEVLADGVRIYYDDAEGGGEYAPLTPDAPCPGHHFSVSSDNVALEQKYPGWPGDELTQWPPLTTEPYMPSSWAPCSPNILCEDVPYLNSAVRTPWIDLAPEGYPRIQHVTLMEMPGADWDNDGDVDDYWHLQIESSDESGIWHELTYASGGGDNDSTYEYWWWDRIIEYKIHRYNGQSVRFQWRINTDGYEEINPTGDPDGCTWDPCIGRGFFLDGFGLIVLGTPANDLAVSRIDVPWLVSVDHPSKVVVELANIGTSDIPSAVTFMFLLDPETLWGRRIRLLPRRTPSGSSTIGFLRK